MDPHNRSRHCRQAPPIRLRLMALMALYKFALYCIVLYFNQAYRRLQGNLNSSGLQCEVAYWLTLTVGSAAQLADLPGTNTSSNCLSKNVWKIKKFKTRFCWNIKRKNVIHICDKESFLRNRSFVRGGFLVDTSGKMYLSRGNSE